ncbi:MAG: hypothetical protein WAP03_26905 [Methylorubrum rhodinum]|uniref:hypothetical protein n=1 Tax=Methylorubrum rhodinum TaxID=29428 RepID=UPI003BB13586
MASNNDSGGGFLIFLILLGILGYILYILFLIAIAVAMTVYAVILYSSIILTVLAVIAAFGGIRFFNLSVSPLHARLFLIRGVAGALLAPSFVWFSSWYYGLHIADWLWPHIVFGGYAMLSTGVFFMDSDGGAAFVEEIMGIEAPPRYRELPPPRAALPNHRRTTENGHKPRFASWDDEEEMRR